MRRLKLLLWLSMGFVAVFWLADYARRRRNAKQVYEATRTQRAGVGMQEVIAREAEDADAREAVLARLPAYQRYYDGRRYELVWSLMPDDAFGMRILDAGCGDGFILQETANVFYGLSPQLVGMDISYYKVKRAHERLGQYVGLATANVETLAFADGVFDAVICTEVLEHLLNVGPGIAELYRVLRPGGRLVVSTPSKHPMFLSFVNPLTWVEAVAGLVVPQVLPPFHDLERPGDPQSVVHRAFTAQEVRDALQGFREVTILSTRVRLPGPCYRVLGSSEQVARIEGFLAKVPVVNQLGETLIVCAVK